MKTRDKGEVVAVWVPPAATPPQAALRLLEGLALWFQSTVRVVHCVGGRCDGSDLSLADACGVGTIQRHRAILRDRQGDFGDVHVAMRRAPVAT